jgi:hypothetical protein
MLKTLGILTLICALSDGCSRSLYHYHRTVIGVDISGNVAGDTPSGHLTLGYSRRLVVLMPPEIKDILDIEAKKKAEKNLSQAQVNEALRADIPDTIFCTQVKASLGGVNTFREVLATGEPAYGYAQHLVALAAGSNDDKYRNFVCPGLEIPHPAAATIPNMLNPGGE